MFIMVYTFIVKANVINILKSIGLNFFKECFIV